MVCVNLIRNAFDFIINWIKYIIIYKAHKLLIDSQEIHANLAQFYIRKFIFERSPSLEENNLLGKSKSTQNYLEKLKYEYV